MKHNFDFGRSRKFIPAKVYTNKVWYATNNKGFNNLNFHTLNVLIRKRGIVEVQALRISRVAIGSREIHGDREMQGSTTLNKKDFFYLFLFDKSHFNVASI